VSVSGKPIRYFEGADLAYGGIELGGTKVNVAIGDGNGAIIAKAQIPTRDPHATLADIAGFFEAHVGVEALGVGAFGPVILDPMAKAYGHLAATPKPGWSDFDLVGSLAQFFGGPILLQTDVAAAGIGEAQYGALHGIECGVYVTVGTGIGAAILVHGQPIPALLHPEMGHLPLVRLAGDGAPSRCPFHANCAEGLVSGPAIEARFGKSLSHFAVDGAEHALVADYLGQFCASLVLAISPQRIILGGGVGKADGICRAVSAAMLKHLNGYASLGLSLEGFIVSPALGDDAGMAGALALARQAIGGAL
jgi:fructokinase